MFDTDSLKKNSRSFNTLQYSQSKSLTEIHLPFLVFFYDLTFCYSLCLKPLSCLLLVPLANETLQKSVTFSYFSVKQHQLFRMMYSLTYFLIFWVLYVLNQRIYLQIPTYL